MKKKCETCVYSYVEEKYRECRLNPPVAMLGNQHNDESIYWGVFPYVYHDDWCGQWKGDPWRGEGDPNYIGEVHATLP